MSHHENRRDKKKVEVHVMRKEDAQARLDMIYEIAGDVEDFRMRGFRYELDAEDSALYEDMLDLEFLLEKQV